MDRENLKVEKREERGKGFARLKGNGYLALTTKELIFFMLAPKRQYRVSLAQIESIEHPKWFRGRSAVKELLVVHFREDDGSDDSYGILVDEPRRWADLIAKVKSGGYES